MDKVTLAWQLTLIEGFHESHLANMLDQRKTYSPILNVLLLMWATLYLIHKHVIRFVVSGAQTFRPGTFQPRTFPPGRFGHGKVDVLAKTINFGFGMCACKNV